MKVLIVRVGAMGDVLHALPAVTALKEARPDWTIDWVVDPRWDALLVDEHNQGIVVGKVHRAETKMWSRDPLSKKTLKSVFKLRRALRKEKYDLAVDMQGTIRSGVIAWMSGAKLVVGYSDPRESLAVKFYKKTVLRHGSHVVDQGAALLSEACRIGLKPAAVTLPRAVWAEDWAEGEAVVKRPMCVMGAGGGWGAKQWHPWRFGELAVQLQAMGFDVVVNSPRIDDPVALKVVEASEGAARMVVCNVAGLVALTRRADLFVGGDSGPTHLAAALGIPLVALYGPTKPSRNGPWGLGIRKVMRNASSKTSYKRVDMIDRGLRRIEVKEVMEAVEAVLETHVQ